MARSSGSRRQKQNKRINLVKIFAKRGLGKGGSGKVGEKPEKRKLKAALATRRKASAPMATQFNWNQVERGVKYWGRVVPKMGFGGLGRLIAGVDCKSNWNAETYSKIDSKRNWNCMSNNVLWVKGGEGRGEESVGGQWVPVGVVLPNGGEPNEWTEPQSAAACLLYT